MNHAAPPTLTRQPLEHAEIRIIIFGVLLAMFLGALDQTIVASALPTIGRELGNVQLLSWVVTAYLLTATAVTPLYGKLSDIYGRRIMLMVAISVFLVGSIACALAPSLFFLIVARGFQGLGGGALISLGQTIIGDVVAPRERGRYQAYFAAVFAGSSVLGPALGGFFSEYWDWSLIFWINLPLGIVAYLMTSRILRRLPRHDHPHKIDVLGAGLMLSATLALLLALTWGGSTYPWGSTTILGLVATSVACWVLFGIRLNYAAEPFIPISVLGNEVVRNATGAIFFTTGSLIGLSVMMPLYFETVLGLDPARSGIALIALLGGTVTGATLSGRIMTRYTHYKRPPMIGTLTASLLAFLMASIHEYMSLTQIEIMIALIGAGLGTVFPVATTSTQNAVPLRQLGTATGVFNFFRSLGSAVMVPVFAAVFLAAAARGDHLVSVEAVIAQGTSAGVDFVHVFTGVFTATSISLLIAFIFQARMKELPLKTSHEQAITPEV